MATILESLKSTTAFPVPLRTFEEVAQRRGLALDEESSQGVLMSSSFNLAVADIYLWLSIAPNVSQGGQSFTFTDVQRTMFRNKANKIYEQFGGLDEVNKPIYGYKGSKL